MRIILAGGSSPLGRDLAAELSRLGHSCVIMSRYPQPEALPYSSLNRQKPDAILNLIGGHRHILRTSDVENALALGKGLLQRAIELSIPLLHLSSGSVLEPNPGPLASTSPLRRPPFQSRYQELKVRFEELHEAHASGHQIIDLRLFSFVGQNFLNEGKYFLSEAFAAIRDRKVLTCTSDNFVRDYSGASELASAVESAFRHGVHGRVNLHSERATSKFELLEKLGEELGLKFTITAGTFSSTSHYHSAPEPQLLGFDPRSSLEVILQEFRKAKALAR